MRFAWNHVTLAATLLFTTVSLGACGAPEEEVEELPEVSELEQPPGETGARELTQEIILGPEDEGETIVATGWVDGRPVEDGFFLRTEYNRLVFVETEETVRAGDAVRVRGRVQKSDATRFDRWETEALGRDLKPDWDLWRGIHLDAEEVTPVEGTMGEGRSGERRDTTYRWRDWQGPVLAGLPRVQALAGGPIALARRDSRAL